MQSTRRSASAGFEVLELHMGHGYLLHQFLSPLANLREGDYGGGFDQRVAFPLRLVEGVRAEWPTHLPLFVRLSVTDWVQGGWDLEQSVKFAQALRTRGVDLIDCSSGSILPGARGKAAPNYQVPFAAAIRQRADIATAAVGLITEAHQAEAILASGQADLIFVGRKVLADPYWPWRAQEELEGKADWPVQYDRAVNPNALG